MVTFVTSIFKQLLGRAVQAHFAFPDLSVQCKVFYAKFIAELVFGPATKVFGYSTIPRDSGPLQWIGTYRLQC
jgi:hypothetical protein